MGARVLPGVGLYDAFSAILSQYIWFIPFMLAWKYMRNASDLEAILRTLVVAFIIYSAPMLFEVRFSPQLNAWFYGYHATDFIQQMRAGGFRPVVFMGHGLLVAFFCATSLIAAVALWRTRARVMRLPPAGVTIYLAGVLILCKSAGPLSYAGICVPLVRFATPRLQMRLAAILVTVALCYPILRAIQAFPTAPILEAATSIAGLERAQSLGFRFDQEESLVSHAADRFWFGWGRFGRNRVYDEETGDDITVTDGRWIITLGIHGFFGLFFEFGLLALPVFYAATALRYVRSREERTHLAALALIVAIWLIDQLPNASLGPWTWLLAGALLGRVEALRAAGRRGSVISASAMAAKPRAREAFAFRSGTRGTA